LLVHAREQAKDTTKYDYIGQTIDSTLYSGNTNYLKNIFYKDYILEKVLKDSKDKSVQEFNKGFKTGIENFDYGKTINSEIGESGSFDFLRSYINEEGEYHLLFRMSADGGLNYHACKLKEINGEIKMIDVYYFMSGDYISNTISDVYKSTIASISNSNVLTRLFKESALSDLLKMNRIKDYMAEQKFEEALVVYETISPEAQKQKIYLLMGMQVAYEVSEEEYQKIIEKYEEVFPNDPSLPLISLDGAFLKKDFNLALGYINKLDRAVGDDPFLDSYRGNVYYEMGDLQNAEKYFFQMYESYPNYAEAYISLLTVLIDQKKYKNALDVLDEFQETFNVTIDSLKDIIKSDYPELINSDAYKNWLKAK
jgi:tetratricopeptide (TPR) repeat protein